MIEISTIVLSNNNNNKINLFLIDKSATEKSLSEAFKKKKYNYKKVINN